MTLLKIIERVRSLRRDLRVLQRELEALAEPRPWRSWLRPTETPTRIIVLPPETVGLELCDPVIIPPRQSNGKRARSCSACGSFDHDKRRCPGYVAPPRALKDERPEDHSPGRRLSYAPSPEESTMPERPVVAKPPAGTARPLPARRLDDFERAALPMPDIELDPASPDPSYVVGTRKLRALICPVCYGALFDGACLTCRPVARAEPVEEPEDPRDTRPDAVRSQRVCSLCNANGHDKRVCPTRPIEPPKADHEATADGGEDDAGLPNDSPTGAATFAAVSCNAKLAPVSRTELPGVKNGFRYRIKALGPFCSATFASIEATCPDACPLKRDSDGPNGCFADSGFSRMLSRRLNAQARGRSGVQVIREECEAITSAFEGGPVPQDGPRDGGRPLRIHVGGDAPDDFCAGLLADAAAGWRRRGGGPVWSYTHSWRHIARGDWGGISVLASIENPADAAPARAQGYVPALVVDAFPDGPRVFEEAGQRYVPCPAEVNPDKVTCVSCRLCLHDDVLERRGLGIAFALHGKHHNEARAQLVQIRTPGAPAPAWQPQAFRCGLCGQHGHKRQRCPTLPGSPAPEPPVVQRDPKPEKSFISKRADERRR